MVIRGDPTVIQSMKRTTRGSAAVGGGRVERVGGVLCGLARPAEIAQSVHGSAGVVGGRPGAEPHRIAVGVGARTPLPTPARRHVRPLDVDLKRLRPPSPYDDLAAAARTAGAELAAAMNQAFIDLTEMSTATAHWACTKP